MKLKEMISISQSDCWDDREGTDFPREYHASMKNIRFVGSCKTQNYPQPGDFSSSPRVFTAEKLLAFLPGTSQQKKGNTTCNLWAVTHSLNNGCYFLQRPQATQGQVFSVPVGRWYSNSCRRRKDGEVFVSLLRCLLLKNWTEFPNIQWWRFCHPWDLSPTLRGATGRGSASCCR